MKKIIAIIWRAWNGKDAAWEYISKRTWAPVYQISSALRMIAAEKNIPETRENLIAIWKQVARDFWDEYLAKKILDFSNEEVIIITWMRQVWQIQYCKNNAEVLFIGILSEQAIRFKRLVQNWKFQWNYEDFLQLELLDEGSVQNVWKCLDHCSVIVENNATIKEFEEKLDKII